MIREKYLNFNHFDYEENLTEYQEQKCKQVFMPAYLTYLKEEYEICQAVSQ